MKRLTIAVPDSLYKAIVVDRTPTAVAAWRRVEEFAHGIGRFWDNVANPILDVKKFGTAKEHLKKRDDWEDYGAEDHGD